MSQEQVVSFLQAALECSVYLAPGDPGLTYEEIYQAGMRAGHQLGEIGDALPMATNRPVRDKRLLPHSSTMKAWNHYHVYEKPDYRNFAAIDMVFSELRTRPRTDTGGNGGLERGLVVDRAIARQISAIDIEASLVILLMSGQLTETDGVLSIVPGGEARPLPGETHARSAIAHQDQPKRNDSRALAYPIVKGIIQLRASDRPALTDPLDAFADELAKLGHGPFRLWWKQIVAELRRCDPQTSPVSVSILAAVLVEGALTFCVKHARSQKLGVFAAPEFGTTSEHWSIDQLIGGAASGNEAAILDPAARYRAEVLLLIRHRIHAGRILADFPDGVPDLRAVSASDPKAIAELILHRVLGWLRKYPPESASPIFWSEHDDGNEFGIDQFSTDVPWQPSPARVS